MLLIRMNECLRLRVHVLNQMLTLKWPKLMKLLPPALSTQPLHQICQIPVPRMTRKRRCFFLCYSSFIPCITFFLFFSIRVYMVHFFLTLFLVWMKSILPKIFGSKRNGRSSDEEAIKPGTEEDDGATTTLGIHCMLSFLLSFHRKSKFPCFMVSLWLILFAWKDLEKIETRKKAFLEAAPIMRKSFSGTSLCIAPNKHIIFTFSKTT